VKHNNLFEETRKELGINLINQYLLVQCERKWKLFGDMVNFENKRVMDIGCTEGHSCIEAWHRGASYCFGIEKEPEYKQIGEAVKKKLGITNEIEFISHDWVDFNRTPKAFGEFDVILALGLLHHIDVKYYEESLRKMCRFCKRTLVLENRVDAYESDKSYLRFEYRIASDGHKVPVSVPSSRWMLDILIEEKFLCDTTFVINAGERELWIARKEK